MSWSNSYFWANSVREKTIEYQMVNNDFPSSTEQFQKEIETIAIVIKTELVTRYKTRYIIVTVRENLQESEIFNLGKRISIIEQNCINKSKELYDNTINRCVYAHNKNEAENLLTIIDKSLIILQNSKTSKNFQNLSIDDLISEILLKINNYKKSKLKPKLIKSKTTRDKPR